MVGVIPDTFTMKELVLMADAKRKEDWEHTISTAETGKYALVFSNLGSSIKLYNKIEV